MSNSLEQLKKRIMRRIYFIFLIRAMAPLAFDGLIIVVILFVTTLFVSIKDVWANLLVAENNGSLSSFSLAAFSGTQLSTKFLLLALGAAGFLAVTHLKRAVRAARLVRDKSREKEKRPTV